ncbi:hypothetical protein DAEQUDRAFT_732383 [Daedalea quercina L-15889]|uniref:Ubiquitin-like protease family profile domain-containing protein n=1 Tax=Daedalea quercina L-15889 TaxID=1314783 RepID=A0A165LME4_9APHY|nr:hypothetical protein DAEQUDRAFT_732383 [Daedalea quercina L-15889]
MSSVSAADRNDTRRLHGIPSSSSSSTAQHGLWKHEPTPIVTPHNNPPAHQSHTSSFNPFSSRITDDLHQPRRGAASGGNRTAQSTPLNYPKRQKRSGAFLHARNSAIEEGLESKHFSLSTKGKGVDRGNSRRDLNGWKDNPEVLVIDDDESVTSPNIQPLAHKPLRGGSNSSSDPLDCIGPVSTKPRHDRQKDYSLSHTSDGSHSSALQKHGAPDGLATQRLRARVAEVAQNSTEEPRVEDPGGDSDGVETIEDVSDDATSKIPGPRPARGTVQKQIQWIEERRAKRTPAIQERNHRDASKSATSIPTIDFSDQPKPSRKDAMKPKHSAAPRASFNSAGGSLAEPSGFDASSAGPSRRALKTGVTTKTRRNPIKSVYLPLEGYSWGCTFVEEEIDIQHPKYWLTWETGHDRIYIRERSFAAQSPYDATILHELEPDIRSLTLTSAPFNDNTPVVVWIKPSPTRINKPDAHCRYKPGSKGGDGAVTFKFPAKHPDVRVKYDFLLAALKALVPRPAIEEVNGFGAKAKWEQVKGTAELAWQSRASSPAQMTRPKRSSTSKQPEDISTWLSNQGSKRRSTPRLNYEKVDADPGEEAFSARRSARLNTDPSPPPGPDELILVYPPSGAGALNIHKSDLKRLDVNNYLNDTLIEFGLKLWLAELKEKNPAFAEQVHVFSSFFYKKLNVRDKNEGYQSVRKWTSRVDLFQKKYIIVPINEHFHWYLAIICNPEYSLLPPVKSESPPKPMTRKRKRESDGDEVQDVTCLTVSAPQIVDKPDVEIVPDSCPPSPVAPTADSGGEDEVECILGPQDFGADADESRPPSAMGEEEQGYLSQLEHLDLQYPRSSPQPMDVDEVPAAAPGEPTGVVDMEQDISMPVNPSSFYGSTSDARTDVGAEVLRIDEDDNTVVTTSEPEKTAQVFIFDSLGSKHPQALKTLTTYLAFEAKDKKGVQEARAAQGKLALVPSQPNYCDCGVYVLHFVRVFMENPESYIQLILSQKGKNYGVEARKADWKGYEVENLRRELQARILSLSETWKADRLSKEEARKKEAPSAPDAQTGASEPTVVDDESDVEVIIEESTSTSKSRTRGPRPS